MAEDNGNGCLLPFVLSHGQDGGTADEKWRMPAYVTFYGSEKVVENYNLMGPVKAALESSVRYMAAELGLMRARYLPATNPMLKREPLHFGIPISSSTGTA